MEAEKEAVWERKKYSSLQGNTVVDYVHPRGEIKVQTLGLLIKDTYIESMDELQAFAKVLSEAWVDKADLHRAFRETLMGPKK